MGFLVSNSVALNRSRNIVGTALTVENIAWLINGNFILSEYYLKL